MSSPAHRASFDFKNLFERKQQAPAESQRPQAAFLIMTLDCFRCPMPARGELHHSQMRQQPRIGLHVVAEWAVG
jgi:hypothetical protein